MAANKIITINEFKEMNNSAPLPKSTEEQQNVKLHLLQSIQALYGERFYRLKEGSRKAIEMLCWLASEKGFVFASDEYLGARYNVSAKTVRNILNELRTGDLIFTVYRRTSAHNGLSAPIHLFKGHAYFERWKEMLKLADFQADFQAEKSETPCESKPEEQKKVPTKYLSFKKNLLKILRKENRLGIPFVPKHIPESFVQNVKPFFDDAITINTLWEKASLAYRQFKSMKEPLVNYIEIINDAFKQTVFAYKSRKIRNDFNGYFFGTLKNMFTYQQREETFADHPIFFNWLEDADNQTVSEVHSAGKQQNTESDSLFSLAKKSNFVESWRENLQRKLDIEFKNAREDEIPY